MINLVLIIDQTYKAAVRQIAHHLAARSTEQIADEIALLRVRREAIATLVDAHFQRTVRSNGDQAEMSFERIDVDQQKFAVLNAEERLVGVRCARLGRFTGSGLKMNDLVSF